MATEVADQVISSSSMVSVQSEGKKSMKAQEYSSLRHAVPKSKISRAILHDNTSRERVLEKQMRHLDQRSHRFRLTQEQNIRTFLYVQKRKAGKWRTDDEARLKSMNFPVLNENVEQRPASAKVVYRNPRYTLGNSTPIYVPLRSSMGISRERTEIIKYQTESFLARLPNMVQIARTKMDWYDRYRGKSRLKEHTAVSDERFRKLEHSLVPTEEHGIGGSHHGSVTYPNIKTDKKQANTATAIGPRSKTEFPVILPKRFSPTRKITARFEERNSSETATRNSKPGRKERKSDKIMTDVKTKNLRDLSKNYGYFGSSHEGSLVKTPRESMRTSGLFTNKSQSMVALEREKTDIPKAPPERFQKEKSDPEAYYVPSLQLYFAGKKK